MSARSIPISPDGAVPDALAVFRPLSPRNVAQVLDRWALAAVQLEVSGRGGLQKRHRDASAMTSSDHGTAASDTATSTPLSTLLLQGDLPEPLIVPAMLRNFTLLPAPPSSDTAYSFHPPSPQRLQQSITYSAPSDESPSTARVSSLVPASCLLTQLATHTTSGTGHTDPPPTGPGIPGEGRLSSSGSGAWAMAEGGTRGGAQGRGEGQADKKKEEDSGENGRSKATHAASQTATAAAAASCAHSTATDATSTGKSAGSRRGSYASIVGGGLPTATAAASTTNEVRDVADAAGTSGQTGESDPSVSPSLFSHPFDAALPPLPSSLLHLPRAHARLLLHDLFASLVALASEQPRAWGVFDTKAREQLQEGSGVAQAAAAGAAKVAEVLAAASEMVTTTLSTASTTDSSSSDASAPAIPPQPEPEPPSLRAQARWVYSHLSHSLSKPDNQQQWQKWEEAMVTYIERLLSARARSLSQRRPSQSSGGAGGGGHGLGSASHSSTSASPSPAEHSVLSHLSELNSLVSPLRQRVGRLWKRVDEAMESSLLTRWTQLHSAEEANEALLTALTKEDTKTGGNKGSGGGSILSDLREYWHAYASCAHSSPGQVLLSGLLRNRIENWQSSLPLPANRLSFEDLVVACDESTSILTEAMEGYIERFPDMVEEVMGGSGNKEEEGTAERTSTESAASPSPPSSSAPHSHPLSLLYSLSFRHFLSSGHLLPRLYTPATFSLVCAGGRLDGRVGERRVGPVRDVLTLRLIVAGKFQEAVWRLRELAEDKEEEARSRELLSEMRKRQGGTDSSSSSSSSSHLLGAVPLVPFTAPDDGRAEAIQADRLEEWMSKYVVAGEFVTSAKSLGGGFTTTKLVTLSPDDLLLPGVSSSDRPMVQLLGCFKPKPIISLMDLQSMKDGLVSSHKKEVAAYRLDRLLGLNHVPLTKSIHLDECEGSLQMYIQECVAARSISQLSLSAPRLPGKFAAPLGSRVALPRSVRLFDFLFDNRDRNLDNYLLSTLDGRAVLIDHSWSHQTPRVVKDLDMAVQGEQAIREMVPARRMVQRMEWMMESSAQADKANAKAKEQPPATHAPIDKSDDPVPAGGARGILEKEMQFLLEDRDVDGIKHRMEMVLSYLRREVAAHGANAVFADADAEEAKMRRRRQGVDCDEMDDTPQRQEETPANTNKGRQDENSHASEAPHSSSSSSSSSPPPLGTALAASSSSSLLSPASPSTPLTTGEGGLFGKLEAWLGGAGEARAEGGE